MCWVAVLKSLIEVVLWQSIINGGFVLGEWACFDLVNALNLSLDPFMGAEDVNGVYEGLDLL